MTAHGAALARGQASRTLLPGTWRRHRALPGCAARPILALDRALCPRRDTADWPERRVVIAGDILAESLRRLTEHVPPHVVQFPQAPEAAAALNQQRSGLVCCSRPGALRASAPARSAMLVFPLAGRHFVWPSKQRESNGRCGWRCTVAPPLVPVVEWARRAAHDPPPVSARTADSHGQSALLLARDRPDRCRSVGCCRCRAISQAMERARGSVRWRWGLRSAPGASAHPLRAASAESFPP